MSAKSEFGPIPRVPKEVMRRILPSENPFVTDADGMVARLNALSRKLPRRYGWRYRTVDGMRNEVEQVTATAADALPLNELYWRDHLGNWEAYSLMNTFRVIDLARSCVWSVARRDVLCASLLARSALETAVSRTVSATISGTISDKADTSPDQTIDLRNRVVVNEELEQYSLKTIFASRLPESETIYNPTNIVTIITRISKIRGQEFILSTYGVLCEAAHPNLLGRTLYVHGSEPGPWDGNELRTIGSGNGPTEEFLAASIVAALSWACATQVSAFELMAQTIGSAVSWLNAARQTSAV